MIHRNAVPGVNGPHALPDGFHDTAGFVAWDGVVPRALFRGLPVEMQITAAQTRRLHPYDDLARSGLRYGELPHLGPSISGKHDALHR